jgi:integrase
MAKRGHGTYAVSADLPRAADGKRRQWRRTGHPTVKEANNELSRLHGIVDLVDTDDLDQVDRVGTYLMGLLRAGREVPEPTTLARKLGLAVELDGKTTVAEWLDHWLAGKRKIRHTTTAGYRSHIEFHIKKHIGHLRLDKLTVGHLVDMFDAIADANEVIAAENAARREQEARCRWTKNGRPPAAERERLAVERARLAEMPPYRRVNKPATWQAIRRTLRTALNSAIAQQLITFNPAKHVELSGGKRPKARLWNDRAVQHWRRTGEKPSAVMVWTPAQLGEFLDAAESHRLYAIFHLIAFRGLRRAEAVGLGWLDTDLDDETITITKAITVDGWTPVEGDPKTEEAAATIALGPLTAQILREQQARQDAEREKAGDRWTETGKVFTTETGGWLHPETVSDEFRAIYKAAGLPPINLRDLRHLAATLIHAVGGDIHAIKETLRHATIKLASDTYTSLLGEVDRDLATKSEGIVPRARKPQPVESEGESEEQSDDDRGEETAA